MCFVRVVGVAFTTELRKRTVQAATAAMKARTRHWLASVAVVAAVVAVVLGIPAAVVRVGGASRVRAALSSRALVLLGALGLVGWLMVATLRKVRGGGNSWRLALVGLYRHRRASLSQIAVFAMTLMLAATCR